MKPLVLAKIAMQVSEYFNKAAELAGTNSGFRNYDNGKFFGVIKYHKAYFQGLAYFITAQHEYKNANETGTGMGKSVSYCKAAKSIFD